LEKSPIESNHNEPKKKDVVHKRPKKRVQPYESHIEKTVQLVVEKLKPEINQMYSNLKKDNQNELRQLRFEIEKIRPPKPTTDGIVAPKEIKSTVNPKNLLQDPEVQNLLSQFKTLQGSAPAQQQIPQNIMQQMPQIQQMQQGGGLMGILELVKALGGSSGGGFGGGSVMGEVMMRSWLAQQNRQTYLYDQLTKQLLTKLGASPEDMATMEKTQNALMDPLKHHGDSVEAAKNQ